jgi:WS/DGAT C-terminal domain/Wax ester synthase-like Acyl-CoA acyltransferase domain
MVTGTLLLNLLRGYTSKREGRRMRTLQSLLFQVKHGVNIKIDEVLNHQNLVSFSYLVLPIATAVAAFVWYEYGNQRRKHNRRASFTSLGLALGTFPIETNVPEAIINAACYFGDEIPTIENITIEVVQPLLQKYERLSQVLNITTGYFGPTQSPVEPKELIRVIEIDSADDKLLHQTVFDHLQDSFIGRTLLPWWEILVIKNNGSGSSALVIRVHHALADGLSLVHAFSPLLTSPNKGQGNGYERTRPSKALCRLPNRSVFTLASSLLEGSIHVLTLGASKFDDHTAFSKCNHAQMKFSGKRDFVIFPTISLEFIKQLKSAANCTVNTILMTAISQAIRDYCISQNDPLMVKRAKVQCRALLPVGFPRSDDEMSTTSTALTNKWCMVSCDMSVGFDDVLDRLASIHESTTKLKESSRAMMQLIIQNSIPPLLPRFLARQAVLDVFSRHSLVLTNVPGPEEACKLAGVPVTGVQLFFSNLLSQVDLLSYAGHVYGNIVYDPDALPEFQNFGRLYARALLLLSERLGVKAPNSLMEYHTGE